MNWQTDDKGNVTFCPLMSFATAVPGNIAVALQVEFARDEATIQSGGEFLQLVLTPSQAIEVAQALQRAAALAMKNPPTSQPH